MPTFVDELLKEHRSTLFSKKIDKPKQKLIIEPSKQIPLNIPEEHNSSSPPVIVNTLNSSLGSKRNLIEELNRQYIDKYINDTLNRKIYDYVSVSTCITCPMQIWLMVTKKVTVDTIDIKKIFSMLQLYGDNGNYLHDKIYKDLNIPHARDLKLDNIKFPIPSPLNKTVCEITLTDENIKLKGRIDIINNNELIDIKSSKENNYSAQLSLYYYLCKIHNIKIDSVKIWYIMTNKLVEYNIPDLEKTYVVYLNWLKELKLSIQEDRPPRILDYSGCNYCVLESICNRYRQTNTEQK